MACPVIDSCGKESATDVMATSPQPECNNYHVNITSNWERFMSDLIGHRAWEALGAIQGHCPHCKSSLLFRDPRRPADDRNAYTDE